MTFDLIPRQTLGDVDLTDYPFAVEFGSEVVAPQNVVQIIQSGLDYGQIQRVTGKSNFRFEIPLLVEGADLAACALAEQLLAAECDKAFNEYRVDPGDGFAATTVFYTFQAQWGFQRDDELEKHGYRRYQLSIDALPAGYSEDEVVDLAVEPAPVTPVTTVMASGASATGWTSPDGAVTSDGTSVLVPTGAPASSFDNYGVTVYNYVSATTYTFAATDFTATKYLSADVSFRSASQFAYGAASDIYTASVDGVTLNLVSALYLGSGITRMTWTTLDPSATTLRLQVGFNTTTISGTFGFKVANVKRSNVVPAGATDTGRQSIRSIAVTGSARTAGSMAIEHATEGLGDVLLYTSPELARGYNPDVTAYRSTSGSSVTPDATTVAGEYITAAKVFNVDASTLPNGPFLLMFRASPDNGTGTRTATITVRSVVGGTTFAEEVLPTVVLPAGLEMATYVAGVMTLPQTRFTDESVGAVQIEVEANNVHLDKVWAFYLGDDADLTFIKAGAGTPALGEVHSAVFLDAPTLANEGAPGLFIGTQSDRSDAFHPGYPTIQSWGRHPFAPPSVMLFLVTTGATNPSATLRHRPAWHTHAAS